MTDPLTITTSWKTLNLTATFPPELQQATQAVSEVTSLITSALDIVKQALEIAEQFTALVAENPVEQAIALILDEIEKLVTDTLNNSIKAHIIAIPFQKRFGGIAAGLRYRTIANDYIPRFRNLLDSGAFADRSPSSVPVEVVNFIDNSINSTGGTAGFWKTLMLSLQDTADLNRPVFGPNDAVAGVCILGGGTDVTEIYPGIALLEQFFTTSTRTDLAAGTRPRVPSIQARAVGGVRASSTRASVLLTWESVSPLGSAPLFSASRYTVTEIFVIRSTDPAFRSKFRWTDVFTREPQDARSDLQKDGATRVIARIVNDGFVTGHVDLDINLEEYRTYYYAIALRSQLNGETQPMGILSNCVRLDLRSSAPSARSTPPDWLATPNLFNLIPIIDDVITTILGALSFLRTRSFSASGLAKTITQIIDQIKNIIDELTAIVNKIERINSQIASIISAAANAVLSVTVITVTKGGMDAWVAELAKRFADESDSSRPQLGPTDLCAGVVMVGGAPYGEQLAGFAELLKKLFGDYNNTFQDAINSIDFELGAFTEKPVFGDNMQPGGAVAADAPKGLDAALRPSSDPTC